MTPLQYWHALACLGHRLRTRAALFALAWATSLSATAQVPDFISEPEDGGEFGGLLTLNFLAPMQDTIALQFEGAGGAQFDCVWNTFGGVLPNMILECTPRTSLPSGSTVTWTVNPEGTGFTTMTGKVLPTTSATFRVPSGGGEVAVTPSPSDGGLYNPDVDGPVTFTFSEAMDTSQDLDSTVSITPGAWTCVWADSATLSCTTQGTAAPGVYSYTLAGFQSASGTPLPPFFGGFVVVNGGGPGGGTPAPECPANSVSLPFPKTLSVCGPDFLVWEEANVFPVEQGTGFTLTGWADTDGASLDSLVRMDAQGQVTTTVMAQDGGTELTPGANPDRMLAVREIASSDLLAVGVYQLDDNLTPVFEQGLTLGDDELETSYLADGRVVIARDLDTQIELTVLSTGGTVAWAKRYSSPAFGADAGGGFPGLGGSQRVSVRETPTGLLLAVEQAKTALDGPALVSTSTNILTHLSTAGAVQWARKYTGLDSFPAPILAASAAGGFVLQAFQADVPDEGDPTFNAILIRLDASGNQVWGKRFTGLTLTLAAELPDGRLLVQGNKQEGEDLGPAVFGILDTAGGAEALVEADYLGGTYGFGLLDGNRIRYTLMASEEGAASDPTTAIIGSSNLQLQDWTWRQYSKPVDSALLVPDRIGSALVFSAFDETTHSLDVVNLDDNLQTGASCTLFTDADVTISPAAVPTSDVAVVVATETVTATDFSPVLQPATIGLQPFTMAEVPVCQGGPSEPTPVTLLVRLADPDLVVVEFDSVTGFNYTVERTGTLGPADWVAVEVIPGNGSRVSRSYAREGRESYFRVITATP